MQFSVPLQSYSLFWHIVEADSVPTSMFPHNTSLLVKRLGTFAYRNISTKLDDHERCICLHLHIC
jgi:hypothetical protein